MADPFSNFAGPHGAALALREKRMQVLATNIANANTPGFKAKDVDFATALSAAMNTPHPSSAPVRQLAQAATFERIPLQPSIDGNTVDADVEKARYAQAALEYQASQRFYQGKISTMLTAITGQ